MAGVITNHMCSIMAAEDEAKMAAFLAKNDRSVYFQFKWGVVIPVEGTLGFRCLKETPYRHCN